MFGFQTMSVLGLSCPEQDIKSIGNDIGERLRQIGITDVQKREIQDEYFQRIRALLGISVIGGNFWTKNHINGNFLVYDQENTGEICDRTKLDKVRRKDFRTVGKFLEQRQIKLEGQRIPDTSDVEQLQAVDGDIIQYGFCKGDNYIYDAGDGEIGLFQITQNGKVEILENISEVAYVRVRTIKIMDSNIST